MFAVVLKSLWPSHSWICFSGTPLGILPRLRMMRHVCLHRLGVPHDLAQLGKAADLTQRHGLRQQIADGRALDGAGDDRTVDGIRSHLVEHPVLDAAAHDIELCQLFALDLLQTLQCPAVFQGKRFIDAAGDLARRFRDICTISSQLYFLPSLIQSRLHS